MKKRGKCLIVDNVALGELIGKSDKTVSRVRKEIREKFGLTVKDKITTYHVAKHLRIPLKHLHLYID